MAAPIGQDSRQGGVSGTLHSDRIQPLLGAGSVVALVCRATEGWPIDSVSSGVSAWGYDAASLMSAGTIWLDMVHPDDREWLGPILHDRSLDTTQAPMAAGTPEALPYLDYRIVTGDGATRWVEDRLRPRRNLDGVITHHEGLLIDVTERVEAQQALQLAQDRNRELADLSPEGFIVADVKGTVTDCNRAFLRLCGFSRDQIVGRHITRLPTMAARDLPRNLSLLTRILRGSLEGPVRFWWVRADGARRLGEARASLVRQEGRVLGIQAVLRDITDEDRPETLINALNRAALAMQPAMALDEILMAAVNELAKLGVNCGVLAVVDDRDLGMRALSFPPKLLAAAERLVGLSHSSYLLPRFDEVEVYRRAVRDGEASYTKDGEELLTRLLPANQRRFAGQLCRLLHMERAIAAPVMVGDRVVAVLSVNGQNLLPSDVPAITAFAHQVSAAWARSELFSDLEQSLTELQETQERLRQVQKMDALGRLAGGVAHDFNNLLTVINGYSEMLLDTLPASDPNRAELTEIHAAGRRAEGLTRQLLAFSRRQPMEMQVLNLNEVLRGMVTMLGRVLGEEIALRVEPAPELGSVRADRGQVEQVIVNLAVNARDAMPEGGTLTIRTLRAMVGERGDSLPTEAVPPAIEAGTYVVLLIRDTGIGMSPEVQERVFEPFFTTKAKGKGIGLGLATVYGIVTQSGGSIGLASTPGEGTEFAIYLPAVDQEADSPLVEAKPTTLPVGSGTILLVEDDRGVRLLTRRMLLKLGFQVLEAENGREALDICRDHDQPIDLVVSDVVMPGMRGPEFVARAKRHRPDLLVLYMSGYTDREVKTRDGDLADAPLLVKPFRIDQLSSMIHQVLDP